MARHTTRFTGVIYRDCITNEKADKTYYIRYKDLNNKTKELKIGKYSEGVRENYCNLKRNEIITKQRLGEELPYITQRKRVDLISFDFLVEKYLETRKSGYSKDKDTLTIKKHLVPYFENQNLEAQTKDDMRSLEKHLKEKNTPQNNTISAKTVNNILSLLIAIINYALKEDLIKNDFAKYIVKDKIDNERERYLTLDEINQLYETIKEDEQLYLFCKLALTTGGRVATILNISKKDIDFTNMIITLKDFKNNTTYKSFLTTEVLELLKTWTKKLEISNKIFYEMPDNIARKLLKILHKLFNQKIDKTDRKNLIVIHSLRHTFASHLAINGTPIFTIQKLMNHKDIKMTLRYAKLSPESGRDAIIGLYNAI